MSKTIQELHLTDVVKDFKLISVKDTSQVQDVLTTLSNKNILSAPVLDNVGIVHKSIDMLDLVAYAVAKLDLFKEKTKKTEHTQVMEFLKKEICHLPDFSDRNPFYTLSSRKSITKAMNLLAHPHFHRIWVEENGVLVGVFTQSKALEILWEHRAEFAPIMKSRVYEVFPEARQTLMIDSKDLLINAFHRINTDKVSGIAVVDDKGVLVGNISASDLKEAKFLNPKDLIVELTHPIEDFMNPTKPGLLAWFFGGKKNNRPFEPIVVTQENTLSEVIEKCVTNKVHRVYVVDKEQKPLHVISLGDIIGQFHFLRTPVGPFRG